MTDSEAGELEQAAPIAVYGASGYTGRLVAAELGRRGLECVLAGRNRAKLEIVAEDAGISGRVEAVALDDGPGLRRMLEPCAAVIACAGPFQLHGEPVVRAAAESGTHYVDTTGEQPFMRLVFDRYGAIAERAGAALVTAMGFDYVPGDMIAALTAAGLGRVEEIVLAYCVTGMRPSQGTAQSALGMMGGGDVEWRAGELQPGSTKVGAGTYDFPAPIGRRRMIRYPAGEHLTVPRHVETANVRTLLAAETVAGHPRLAAVAPLALPALRFAARTPARRLLEAGVARLPEGPAAAQRRSARFMLACEAKDGERRRRGVITGSDVYGLTARTTVEAAARMASPGYDRAGALAPSEAFDPSAFLDSLASFGVDYEIAAEA